MADGEDIDEQFATGEGPSIADLAVQTALDQIRGSQGKRPPEVRPTPEHRSLILPFKVPRGSDQPELAVPGILHEPYEAFQKMWTLLEQGAEPSDPAVVAEATKVAGLVAGGTVSKRAGGVARRGASPTRAEETIIVNGQETKLDDFLRANEDDPDIASSIAEAFALGKESLTLGGGAGPKVRIELPGAKRLYTLEQDDLIQALADEGVTYEMYNAITDMGLTLNKMANTNEWILSGPGANNGEYLFDQFKLFGKKLDVAALEDHMVMLERKAGAEQATEIASVPIAKEGNLSVFQNELGDWILQGKGPEIIYKDFGRDFEGLQAHLAEMGKPKVPASKLKLFDEVIVDGKPTTWASFSSKYADDSDLMDALSIAKEAGVGKLVYQAGDGPDLTIDLPSVAKAPAPSANLNRRVRNMPTELEMQNWPDATRIDAISMDEAHPGPIIAYHGSSTPFIKFDLSKSADIGNHFGTQEQAKTFSFKGTGEAQRIIPAYIDVKNPIQVPDLHNWNPIRLAEEIAKRDSRANDLPARVTKIYPSSTKTTTIKDRIKAYNAIRKELDKLGYDAIRYHNQVEGNPLDTHNMSYIIWKPGTVKSATTPDHILYVKGPGPLAAQSSEDKQMGGFSTDAGSQPTQEEIDEAYRMLDERIRSARPQTPASPTPEVPGTIVDQGPEPEADLGIEPPSGMSPERAALARSVFGMARSGKATLESAGESVQKAITDMPQALERAKTPANMRGILRGTFGAGGGMAGTAFGPVGVGVGTFGGAALGGYLANIYDDFYNAGADDKPALMQQLTQPLRDAAVDASITGGVVALPHVVGAGKRLLAQLMRLPPNSPQLLREASDIGVDIGVANVTGPQGIGGGAVNVMGRLPILGSSAKSAARQQARRITAAYNDMFGKVAEQRTVSEVGQDAIEAGTQRFTEFARNMQLRYEYAARIGEEAGPIVKTNLIKGTAKRALAEIEELPGGIKMQLPAQARKILEAASKLGDNVSTIDIKSLDYYLENAIRKAASQEGLHYPKLAELRTALRQSLEKTSHPAAKAMSGVDKAFEAGLVDLGTEMAHKFGRVERNIFATGKVLPGTVNTPDKAADLLLSLNSANAVNNARRVVGDKAIRQAARMRLDDAWLSATEGSQEVASGFKWSASKFSKALGLDNPDGKRFEATKEMLRGSGIDIADLEKLARVAESVGRAPLADASTFLARAAVLRGASGLGNALKASFDISAGRGGGVQDSAAGLATTVATMGIARWGLGHMMRPGLLKNLATAMEAQSGTPAGQSIVQGQAQSTAQVAALYELFANYPDLFVE